MAGGICQQTPEQGPTVSGVSRNQAESLPEGRFSRHYVYVCSCFCAHVCVMLITADVLTVLLATVSLEMARI